MVSKRLLLPNWDKKIARGKKSKKMTKMNEKRRKKKKEKTKKKRVYRKRTNA